MQVPNKLVIDNNQATNFRPAGYSDSEDDYDDDDTPYYHPESTVKIKSPPKTITTADISKEEKRRYMRNNYDTNPLDYSQTQIINSKSTSGTQVRHLHNRVRLLEEELQTIQRRQMLLIGIVSGYSLMGVIKWLCK